MDDEHSSSSSAHSSPKSSSPLKPGFQPNDEAEVLPQLRQAVSFSSLDSINEPQSSKKGLKKHNLAAVFGQKLTNNKSKEQGGGLKMFRHSKTDLKALRMKTDLGIQTSLSAARSSINDRSPMTRTSRELDRIAALGSPNNNPIPLLEPPNAKKHHISFRKKDSPSAKLSSSASNSRLDSQGSLYSFHQPTGVNINLEKSFKSIEDCQQTLTYTWSLLFSRTQSIFSDAQMRIPVEDTNTLVSVYFSAHVWNGGTALEMIDKMNELLLNGMGSFAQTNLTKPGGDILVKCASTWKLFFTRILLMLEAVFLPLQLEMDGCGSIIKSQTQSDEYWEPLRKNNRTINVRRCILIAYRDVIILPYVEKIQTAVLQGFEVHEHAPDTAARITQCINTLGLIQSQDASQAKIENLLGSLRESWLTRPRMAKDRRGLVLRRTTA